MRYFLPSLAVLAFLLLGNQHWPPSSPTLKKVSWASTGELERIRSGQN